MSAIYSRCLGAKPEFQYFEAPIVIDNTANEVIDNAA
jgi:hypothetical protein